MSLRHILSADQFAYDFLLQIFANADRFRKLFSSEDRGGRETLRLLLPGKIMQYLFFEPSSRTRLSFQCGANHLGMIVAGTDMADQFSSFAKYEEIGPAFRTMSGYGTDIIVMRSKQKGDVARAAEFSLCPMINAGDGTGEHPTQALLDLYTIWQEFGRLDNLVVGLGGDLLRGRTIHSLIRVLSKFGGNRFILASPDMVRLPDEERQLLLDRGCSFVETSDYKGVLADADVWYWTRVQFERAETDSERERLFPLAQGFAIGMEELEMMKDRAILMHPQPIDKRIWEVRENVVHASTRPPRDREESPIRKVRIFEQSDNGLWARMALIYWVVTGSHQHHL